MNLYAQPRQKSDGGIECEKNMLPGRILQPAQNSGRNADFRGMPRQREKSIQHIGGFFGRNSGIQTLLPEPPVSM
jgi:hypothetical protein